MGKAYVLLILCVSAPSGFVMSLYANGGLWTKISFSLISVLWFMFTLQAYRKIKNRNIQAHTDFMIRSYALTLSAITLRTYVVILPHFFILHSREMYTLISWLSWVPNLLLAELLIRKRIFHPY
ncbi:Predicted membrane protein [Cytophaga hutchinsonii ATCC 33406]|nr:Predicted membrane protein [Cytophaga hutchinsonii ATCC 33406]